MAWPKGRLCVSGQGRHAVTPSDEPAPRVARARGWKWLVFALIIAVYAAAQWAGRRDIPLTDDAEFYLGSAQAYKAWSLAAWNSLRHGNREAFRREVIDGHFGQNWMHPPFAKAVLGAGIAIFHDGVHWLDEIDAARVGIMLLSTLLAALIFLLCWPTYGPLVAVSAPLFLLVMPRFFFDSHVESLDVASAATYFLAVFCFWRARASWLWAVAAGTASGIAMATKINGAFVALPVGTCWLLGGYPQPSLAIDRPLDWLRRPPLSLVLMVTLGPLVAIGLWPWLWADPITRLVRYLRFYLHHHPTLFHYFGTTYYVPFAPWHAPFVMTAITTPVPILALALIGTGVAGLRSCLPRASTRGPARSEANSLDRLVLLNAAFAVGAAALPNVPKYGGVKLFLPFFPFLAILAGVGFEALTCSIARVAGIGRRATLLAGGVGLATVVGTMGCTMMQLHPYHLSYYNGLVGGLSGAERHGFEIQYYDLWYLELARWLNRTYPDGVRVFFQPNNKEYLRHVGWYYRTGRLNQDVQIVPDESQAEIVVLTHEKRWPQYFALRGRLRNLPVLHELIVEGVPLLTVYDVQRQP